MLAPWSISSKLNPPQREAASHGGGPLLVLAGAGSGKTRVITFRIAHLLAQGVPPQAICAVTFTNKAAEEMRERVAHLLGDKKLARELTIGTFHALGLQILRSERKALGLPRGFAIYDQADQLGAVREAMRTRIHDGERRYDAKAILTRISLAKNAFIAPDEYEGNPADEYDAITTQRLSEVPGGAARVRRVRLRRPDRRAGAAVRERDEDVRERWAERGSSYVMVDEFQDTNRAQLRMVQALVAQHEQPVRRRRRRPVDLQLARRRSDEHPRVRRAVPGREDRQARAELPLDEDDPRRRERR